MRRKVETAGAIVFPAHPRPRRSKCIRHRRAKSSICIKNTGRRQPAYGKAFVITPAFVRRYDVSAKWRSVCAITRSAMRYSKYRARESAIEWPPPSSCVLSIKTRRPVIRVPSLQKRCSSNIQCTNYGELYLFTNLRWIYLEGYK